MEIPTIYDALCNEEDEAHAEYMVQKLLAAGVAVSRLLSNEELEEMCILNNIKC